MFKYNTLYSAVRFLVWVHTNSLDFDEVKSVILKKYINPETYRQRFRSLHVEPEETPRELYVKLEELNGKWMQPKGKTTKDIGKIIILEKYLRMLSPELQVWVKEQHPNISQVPYQNSPQTSSSHHHPI